MILEKWIEGHSRVMGWMTGGGIAGSVIAFLAGFLVGTIQGLLGPHIAPVSGFDHWKPRESVVLPWILMFFVGYTVSQLTNRAFDCTANPSCIPYPSGPFGGGGGGGW